MHHKFATELSLSLSTVQTMYFCLSAPLLGLYIGHEAIYGWDPDLSVRPRAIEWTLKKHTLVQWSGFDSGSLTFSFNKLFFFFFLYRLCIWYLTNPWVSQVKWDIKGISPEAVSLTEQPHAYRNRAQCSKLCVWVHAGVHTEPLEPLPDVFTSYLRKCSRGSSRPTWAVGTNIFREGAPRTLSH